MRTLLPLLGMLLTATVAPALSGPGTFLEQGLTAAFMLCGLPIILLVSLVVFLRGRWAQRDKNTDSAVSARTPSVQPPGPTRTAPPPGN